MVIIIRAIKEMGLLLQKQNKVLGISSTSCKSLNGNSLGITPYIGAKTVLSLCIVEDWKAQRIKQLAGLISGVLGGGDRGCSPLWNWLSLP